MFKKYYKEANDYIKTNKALIDKIFEEAEKPSKKKAVAKVYKFGMAAAAVLVLAISVSLLPKLMQNDVGEMPAQPIAPIAQKDANVKTDEKVQEVEKTAETPSPEKNEEKVESNAEPAKNDTSPEKKVSESEKTEIQPIEADENSQTNVDEQAPVLAMETGENTEPAARRGRMAGEDVKEIKELSVNVNDFQSVTEEESIAIQELFINKYGTVDKDNGYDLAYNVVGKAQVNGETYYFVRMSWLVVDHWSLLQNFVLNETMDGLYFSVHSGDYVYWSLTRNQLEL